MKLPLKVGSEGKYVEQWQRFLGKHTYLDSPPSGVFDAQTRIATRKFQSACRLEADGVAGNYTLGAAIERGLRFSGSADDVVEEGPNWPTPPSFNPLGSISAIQAALGRFDYELVRGRGSDRESIRILGNWEQENIARVSLPGIASVKDGPSSGSVRFHRLAAKPLRDLWRAWSEANLLDRIVSWGGSYNPRYKRGVDVSRKDDKNLSNHSFGTAFDINVSANAFHALPALLKQKGSVRELVEIANNHGFYWGGHFKTRLDGMHFEVAVLP